MTLIFRVVSEWSGFSGGPGYTNHFFRNILPDGTPSDIDDEGSAILASERVRTFWDRVANFLPDDVTINVETTVDQLEDTNGVLQGSYNVQSQPAVRGINGEVYSAASGAVIGWNTGAIRNGRRIRGRTFLVPLSGTAYSSGGQIGGIARTAIQDAATAFAVPTIAATFGVWARPSAKGASDGQWAQATGAQVPSKVAILKSRRD